MATTNKPEDDKQPNLNDQYGPPDEDDGADIAEPIEPAEQPAAKAKPTPTTSTQPPVASPSLRRIALQLGVSKEDIESVTPDELEQHVEFLLADRNATRTEQAKAKEPVDEDDEVALESIDKDLSLDPRMKKLLKKQITQAKETSKELAAYKKALAERDERDNARVAQAGVDAVESAIAELGDDYKAILGEGTLRDLGKDSEEAEARNAIFARSGIDFQNDSPAMIARKYKAAAKKLFGKFVGQQKRSAPADEEPEEPTYQAPKTKKKPGPELDLRAGNRDINWDDATTARPTNRKAPGRKDPREAVRQYYQENGIPGGDEGDVFNGVPE